MSKQARPRGLANSLPSRSSRLSPFLCILFVPVGASGKTTFDKRHSERDTATLTATGGKLGYRLVYAHDGPDQRASIAFWCCEASLSWAIWRACRKTLADRSNEPTDWLGDQDLADTTGSSDCPSPCTRVSSSLTRYTSSITPFCSA